MDKFADLGQTFGKLIVHLGSKGGITYNSRQLLIGLYSSVFDEAPPDRDWLLFMGFKEDESGGTWSFKREGLEVTGDVGAAVETGRWTYSEGPSKGYVNLPPATTKGRVLRYIDTFYPEDPNYEPKNLDIGKAYVNRRRSQ